AHVERVLDRSHGVADGVFEALDGFLHRSSHRVDRLGDGGGSVLHRIGNLMLEGLQFLGEGLAGLLHLVSDQFGFLVHWRFSFTACWASSELAWTMSSS